MKNVYENCPVIENEKYLIRLISIDDANDLQKVYGTKMRYLFSIATTVTGIIFIILP